VTQAVALSVAHSADLDEDTRRAARVLLDDVFDDMADEDWEHALGGMPALVWEGAELIGHASVIQRQLLYGGRAWRTGYVEAVAVRADRRRSGHGGAMMDAVERIIRGRLRSGRAGVHRCLGALYAARGWLRWRGPCSALTPAASCGPPRKRAASTSCP
jgi:aminoglycoside 2'-N-acetyltransferase I